MKKLFYMITLVLGVAIGFVACGDDDDDKTDTPVESSVDAGVEADSAAGGTDGAAGSGGESTEEVDAAGAGGEGGSAGAAGEAGTAGAGGAE